MVRGSASSNSRCLSRQARSPSVKRLRAHFPMPYSPAVSFSQSCDAAAFGAPAPSSAASSSSYCAYGAAPETLDGELGVAAPRLYARMREVELDGRVYNPAAPYVKASGELAAGRAAGRAFRAQTSHPFALAHPHPRLLARRSAACLSTLFASAARSCDSAARRCT